MMEKGEKQISPEEKQFLSAQSDSEIYESICVALTEAQTKTFNAINQTGIGEVTANETAIQASAFSSRRGKRSL